MRPIIILFLFIDSYFLSLPSVAEFIPQSRDNQVIKQIEYANRDLLEKDKHQKYCKMRKSPYLFYRGTNHLFWKDFQNSDLLSKFGDKQTHIWIGGDQHAENFGAYSNNQDHIIYGMNDFDESMIADYQYDLWRLAISLVLIADQQGLNHSKEAIELMSNAYLKQLQHLIVSNDEHTLVMDMQNTSKPLNKFLKKVAKKKSRLRLLSDWSHITQGQRQFKPQHEDLMPIVPQLSMVLRAQWSDYIATSHLANTPHLFKIKDIAQRIHAGTGSLGTARYYVLIEGETASLDDDRILDIKQQNKVAGWAYLNQQQQQDYAERYPNSAQRHAQAYHALTNYTDHYLGWLTFNQRTYSVRERSPYKKTFKAHKIKHPNELKSMSAQWGKLLASSHARADSAMSRDKTAYSFKQQISDITKNKTTAFVTQITSIALTYAQQVNNDYQSFKHAYDADCRDLIP